VLGAHAHTLWIALGLAGCAVGAFVTRRLERVLPPVANGAVVRAESTDAGAAGVTTELKISASTTS
jgi:hypothetical protein